MISHPDKAKDIDVEVIEYADGYDPNIVRVVNKAICAMGADCVLLGAKRSLGLKDFPTPARAHNRPNNGQQTMVASDVSLLAYNGLASSSRLNKLYPETPRDVLYKAFADLLIDRLSYATGKTVAIYDGVVINHQVFTREEDINSTRTIILKWLSPLHVTMSPCLSMAPK
jgi:hypothetical protein